MSQYPLPAPAGHIATAMASGGWLAITGGDGRLLARLEGELADVFRLCDGAHAPAQIAARLGSGIEPVCRALDRLFDAGLLAARAVPPAGEEAPLLRPAPTISPACRSRRSRRLGATAERDAKGDAQRRQQEQRTKAAEVDRERDRRISERDEKSDAQRREKAQEEDRKRDAQTERQRAVQEQQAKRDAAAEAQRREKAQEEEKKRDTQRERLAAQQEQQAKRDAAAEAQRQAMAKEQQAKRDQATQARAGTEQRRKKAMESKKKTA